MPWYTTSNGKRVFSEKDVPDNELDDFLDEIEGPSASIEQPSMLSRAWDTVNKPLVAPEAFRSNTTSIPNMATDKSGLFEKYVQPFMSGVMEEGIPNTLSSMTSPLNIGLMGIGMGEAGLVKAGMPALARPLGMVNKAVGAGVAGHGANTTYEGFNENDPSKMLFGAAEMAGGGLGMAAKLPKVGKSLSERAPLEKVDLPEDISPIMPDKEIEGNITVIKIKKPTNELVSQLREQGFVSAGVDKKTGYPMMKRAAKPVNQPEVIQDPNMNQGIGDAEQAGSVPYQPRFERAVGFEPSLMPEQRLSGVLDESGRELGGVAGPIVSGLEGTEGSLAARQNLEVLKTPIASKGARSENINAAMDIINEHGDIGLTDKMKADEIIAYANAIDPNGEVMTALSSADDTSAPITNNQPKGRASFLGTQEGFQDIPEQDLYNIDWEGHPLHESTVGAAKLRELGIDIPDKPTITQLDPNEGLVNNASLDSEMSSENLSRLGGMKDRGEEFIIFDRAGNAKPATVDSIPRIGETYGVMGPNGFVSLNENGGKVPSASTMASRLKSEAGVMNIERVEPKPEQQFKPGRTKTTRVALNTNKPETIQRLKEEGYRPTGNNTPDGKPIWQKVDEATSPSIEEKSSKTREIYNLARGTTTSFDISAPMRQGLPLVGTKAWFKAWGPMLRSYGSEGAYRNIMTALEQKPLFKPSVEQVYRNGEWISKEKPSFASQSGLNLTDLNGLTNREEALMSNLAERIPLGIGKGIKASNRAYTAFLNELRANTFESLIKDATDMGLSPQQDMKLAKEIADFVNDATGRGKLAVKVGVGNHGREFNFEQHSKILTDTLFSPRLMASRVRMLNPSTYMMANPMVRKQYMKAALRTATAWITMASLGKMAGAEVSLDPTNADFGKIKIGNTRLDAAGGFQQFLVGYSRMISGKTTSSTSGKTTELGQGFKAPTRKSIGEDFLSNKLHPVLKFGYDLWDASAYKPFHVGDRIAQLYIPLVAQDIIELAKSDPTLLPLSLLTSIGMGTQTYEKGGADSAIVPEEFDLTLHGGGF